MPIIILNSYSKTLVKFSCLLLKMEKGKLAKQKKLNKTVVVFGFAHFGGMITL